jgi:hypothetical protein
MLDREEIKKIIDDYKEDKIKEITKKNYVSKIYNFHIKNENLNLENEKDLIDYFTKKFNEYKTTSLMGIISSLIIYLQAKKKEFKLLLDYLFTIQKEYRKKLNKKNEKESENWMDYEELKQYSIKKYKELKLYKYNKDLYLENLKECLVIFLYVFLPPRRNDYKECYYITESKYKKLETKDKNYLVFVHKTNKQYFSFNEYKTYSTYGQQIIDVENKMLKNLLNKNRKMDTSNLMFSNENNNPMSSSEFTRFLNTAFLETGKKISSSLLRKIFISNQINIQKVKNNIDKAKNIAYKMGHSLNTQQNIYYKDS